MSKLWSLCDSCYRSHTTVVVIVFSNLTGQTVAGCNSKYRCVLMGSFECIIVSIVTLYSQCIMDAVHNLWLKKTYY